MFSKSFTDVHNKDVAYKCFLIGMVLFCAYMQWSPVVDFDYVWINGYEHCVGASNPHGVDTLVTPTPAQPVGAVLADSAFPLLMLPVTQSMERLMPVAALRL